MESPNKILLLLVILLVGCGLFNSSSNPYEGDWEFIFAGSNNGSGVTSIDSEGNFDFSVLLSTLSGSVTNTISGSVDEAGKVTGDIFFEGANYGNVSGSFEGNSGSGTYETDQPSSGSWSATRQ